MLQQELIRAPVNNKPLVENEAAQEEDVTTAQASKPAMSRPRRQAARKAVELFGRILLVTDGADPPAPADQLYGAQYQAELARHRSVGAFSKVNMPYSVRHTTNPVSFYATGPATTSKLRNVNPYIFNKYGEDIFVDLNTDDDYSNEADEDINPDLDGADGLALLETSNEQDDSNSSLNLLDNNGDLQQVHQAMRNLVETRQQAEVAQPQPEVILQPVLPENDEETDNNEDYSSAREDGSNSSNSTVNDNLSSPHSSTSAESDINNVSLTSRGDHSERLDSLLQAGLMPPVIPPRSVQLPIPDLPPRSRTKSFKGSQYDNYADLHSGRVRKNSKSK